MARRVRSLSSALPLASLAFAALVPAVGCRKILGLSDPVEAGASAPEEGGASAVPPGSTASGTAQDGAVANPWDVDPTTIGYYHRARSCREEPRDGGIPLPIVNGHVRGAGFDCGPRSNDDCCASIAMDGGTFFTSTADAPIENDLADGGGPGRGLLSMVDSGVQFVGAFALDKYEVTVGRFNVFMNSGGGTSTTPPRLNGGAVNKLGAPTLRNSGWSDTWAANLEPTSQALFLSIESRLGALPNDDPSQGNFPIGAIDWYTAFAFCIWDGGRLPTETEWIFAATGGNLQRVYPWSNPSNSAVVDFSYASYCYASQDNSQPLSVMALGRCVPYNSLAVPGTYSPKGDGPFGHADLGGNIAEWNLDVYSSPSYCKDAKAECANLTSPVGPLGEPAQRVVHGGDWSHVNILMQGAFRNQASPQGSFLSVGVRCARDLVNPLSQR